MKINGILFLILLITSNFVQAGVFKHVDNEGNVTYSNVRSGNNAKPVDLPSITVVPAIQTEAVNSIIKRRKEASSNKKQRSEIEGQIADEENHLSALKDEYKDGTPDRLGSERNYQRYLDRVERLKGEIAARENNLSNLQRTLQDLPSPNN
ncbi:MAG: DUF4124 domain-containing protein [Nitrosomonas sp.]|nr:DUF4124 domain-containing protein [Nitrosomonas sp.]